MKYLILVIILALTACARKAVTRGRVVSVEEHVLHDYLKLSTGNSDELMNVCIDATDLDLKVYIGKLIQISGTMCASGCFVSPQIHMLP